jgi:uncharacterized membrane protein
MFNRSLFFKKKPFFSASEQDEIVAAIREAELQTSGEIRVYLEKKNPLPVALERARQIFFRLKMDKTQDRNAVLIYIGIKRHELAFFGDEGIYTKVGQSFWESEIQEMVRLFRQHEAAKAVVYCIRHTGDILKMQFPYREKSDKNELPDNIVFGK